MIYSLHEGIIPTYGKKEINIEAVYNEGEIIKDCSFLITESMIDGCLNNIELVRNCAILEGAKLDMMLSNFMKEGKDYKGLKKDLNEIINANNMDKSELISKGKGFMHICKRILQISQDLATVAGTGVIALKVAAAPAVPGVIIASILGFVIGFISNRLLRYLCDTVEFETIKKDAESIVKDLRSNAKKAEDPDIAKKLNSEADKLEASIKKYSSNSKKD